MKNSLTKQNFTLWFLRRFSMFRYMEKRAESDAILIGSLNRYIEALEGRDKERMSRITELAETIKELRKKLSDLLPREARKGIT